jgi:hypothetical protein
MYSFAEQTKIVCKWLLSFSRGEWRLKDYPIRVRRNGTDPAPGMAWAAQILNWPGPCGLGATPKEAWKQLEENIETIRKNRPSMPRPGTEVPIQFASSVRVSANATLLDDFIERILEFKAGDPVFVSDLSSLHDFGDEEKVSIYRKKIFEVYGIDVSDLKDALICDIVERIDKSS